MERIVFLDVDGVLNSYSGLIKRGGQTLMDSYDEHLQILDWLVHKAEAKIVVSSTWRLKYLKDEDWTAMSEDIFGDQRGKGIYSYRHLKSKVIGATPSIRNATRGGEIFRWLEDYTGSIEEFVIIDDDDDMKPFMDHLVQTNGDYGLTYVEAYKALVKLLGDREAQSLVWSERYKNGHWC